MEELSTPSARYLEGKIAIVTGASRGIGAAVCELLASKGCSLAMNYSSDSSTERSRQLGLELESKYGVRVVQLQADIGSELGPELLVSSAKAAFQNWEKPESTFQIDIVVNNAGTASIANLQDCSVDSFATMYHLNVRGPMLLMKAAFPYLPHDRSGRIVNISSMASMAGLIGQTIYGGTKAALEAMTRTWSRELAEKATVNAINPGTFHGCLLQPSKRCAGGE
jgi:NAD(P)-dependent dehydrogenase (short-subunit alcohol dehydrogenase family)